MCRIANILFYPKKTQRQPGTAYRGCCEPMVATIAIPRSAFILDTALKQAALDHAMLNDNPQEPAKDLTFADFIRNSAQYLSWHYGFEIMDRGTTIYQTLEYDDGVIVTAEEIEHLRKCPPGTHIYIPPKISIPS